MGPCIGYLFRPHFLYLHPHYVHTASILLHPKPEDNMFIEFLLKLSKSSASPEVTGVGYGYGAFCCTDRSLGTRGLYV